MYSLVSSETFEQKILKVDDITNYINVKHSCQEFSLFQIERLGDNISARAIREAARAVDQ